MDFFNIGDKINVKDLNALTYLLRKFKRLNAGLRLGALTLESDYGSFTFDKPLTSVGGNFIIESDVNVSSSDCLRNCFYSFVFNVIDVNTSGTVNKRQVRVTGGTGDDGTLFVTLPTDLIESDEVILPNFELDIVFDEHEYYTPVVDVVNVDLVSDKRFVGVGEVATVTATLTDSDGELLVGVPCIFNVNGQSYSRTTDENGEAEYEYTGTGVPTTINIRVVTTHLTIYDTPMTATVTTNSVSLGQNMMATGDIIIDWGDGTTTTRQSGDTTNSSHTYTDGQSEHTIGFIGEITRLGDYCFRSCTGLTSINIPNSVVSLGRYCFWNCVNLPSIVIPNNVTSLGYDCFIGCTSLVDYQLYWRNTEIVEYTTEIFMEQSNAVFTIPYGQSANYIAKKYPSNKISERSSSKTDTSLSIQSSKSSYYTDEYITITGSLIDENNLPVVSASVKLYENNQLINTLTTDSNGEYAISSIRLTAGAYTYKAIYDGDSTYEASTSSNLNITVKNHVYSLSIASDKQSLLPTESVTLSGTLLKDSNPYASQSVDLYDGATKIATLTTDSDGEYEETVSNLSVGVHTFKAVNTNAQSSTLSIVVNEPTPTYHIVTNDVTMSYYDGTRFVATVLDENDQPYGEGETLTFLFDGTTYSRTISSDGEASMRLNKDAGTYTIVTTFGDVSVINTIIINKLSTTTSLTASSSSILTTDTLTLTGAVTGVVMGETILSPSVKIYDGSTLVDTITTTGGSYSKSLTGLSVGTHSFKAVYDGGINWNGSESSTVTVTVTESSHDYSLSVASSKDILSYADGESATITATLTDNSVAVAGETLSYVIKHGSTTISSGSDTTDSNGQISFNYISTGIGDVTIEVDYGILLQEIYAIEDCFYNNPMTSADSSHWTIPSNANATYSSNGMKLQGSSWADCYLELPITKPCSIEYDMMDYTGTIPYYNYFYSSDKSQRIIIMYRQENGHTVLDTNGSTGNRINYTIPKEGHVKLQFDNDSIGLYVDDVLQISKSYSMPSSFVFGVTTSGSRSTTYKNIKVKAL